MTLRVLFGGCAVGIVATALLCGHWLRQQQDADALAKRAQHLLHASAADAPELSHVQAAKARALLDDALRLSDAETLHGQRHLASAYAYLQKNDMVRAKKRLAEAERHLGSTADTHYIRAALLQDDHKYPAAQAALGRALTEQPGHTRAALLQADLCMLTGKPGAALSTVQALIARQGTSASAENRRGLALEAMDDGPGAKQAFRKATQLDARLYAPHLNLARRLRIDGDSKAALLSFVAAKERGPEDPAPFVGSGLCRLSLGDHLGAAADLEHALTLDTGNPDAHVGLGDLAAAQGDPTRAYEHYRIALRHRPDDAVALLKQGNTLMLLGRHDDAAKVYRSAVTKSPDLAAAHNGLGAALLATQDRRGAALSLARAAKLNPVDPNPLLNLARLHRLAGDEDQARQALVNAEARQVSAGLRLAKR